MFIFRFITVNTEGRRNKVLCCEVYQAVMVDSKILIPIIKDDSELFC